MLRKGLAVVARKAANTTPDSEALVIGRRCGLLQKARRLAEIQVVTPAGMASRYAQKQLKNT